MKNKAKMLLFLFVLLLVTVACGNKDEETAATPELIQPTQPAAIIDNGLIVQAWQWVSFLDQATGEAAIADPQNYIVNFQADGTVQVKADCNNASGSYTADGTTMAIVLGPSTMAACPLESKGNQFLAYLNGVMVYSLGNGRLQIQLMADGGTMTFISANAIVPTAVSSTTGEPTAIPPVAATTAPPTAIQPTPVPPPTGSIIDGGSRTHATGTYAAPHYTVAAGDTLFSVSLRFNLLPDQIKSANGMTDNTIYTNQLLVIPGADTNATPIPSPNTPERVAFASGAISASLSRFINSGQPKQFVLTAMAGQTMQISTQSSAEYLMITVHDTNGTSMPLGGVNGQGQNNVSIALPYTGDYLIIVTPTTPPEGPTMAFDITFAIQ